MSKRPPERQRAKISATVDPDLLKAVDAYVDEHPELDRSKVLDEALGLWYAREQDRAMEAQFADGSGVDPEEWQAWRAIRDEASNRLFRRRGTE
jgi:hypothetical protein